MSDLELPEDSYVVCNILVDDDSIDLEFGGSRADYFEVQYDGESLRIAPYEERVLPEHLARHFAKHLVDYMLHREGRMIHDQGLRAPLIGKIILRKADESDRISRESDQGNSVSPEKPRNIENGITVAGEPEKEADPGDRKKRTTP